jgi:excisionase family DNA binding protein
MSAQARITTTSPASTEAFQLLNTKQAAACLGIGIRTLQERVAAREIAAVKIGKRVLFDIEDLRAFVKSSKAKAVAWKGGSK